jgi:hypothetical protein
MRDAGVRGACVTVLGITLREGFEPAEPFL